MELEVHIYNNDCQRVVLKLSFSVVKSVSIKGQNSARQFAHVWNINKCVDYHEIIFCSKLYNFTHPVCMQFYFTELAYSIIKALTLPSTLFKILRRYYRLKWPAQIYLKMIQDVYFDEKTSPAKFWFFLKKHFWVAPFFVVEKPHWLTVQWVFGMLPNSQNLPNYWKHMSLS